MQYTFPEERFKENITHRRNLLFCNRFNTLVANVPGCLQTELTVLPKEHSLSLVKHAEDNAIQLKKFLCVLQFWTLSRKHSAGLSNFNSRCPVEFFEEKSCSLGRNINR